MQTKLSQVILVSGILNYGGGGGGQGEETQWYGGGRPGMWAWNWPQGLGQALQQERSENRDFLT